MNQKRKTEITRKLINITCAAFKTLYCEIPLSFRLLSITDDYIHDTIMGKERKSDERKEYRQRIEK